MSCSFEYSRAETLLKVTDLCVTYDRPILTNVNFEIKDVRRPGLTQGQKVALLAPSGTGKTQLLKRLAGLEPPTTGSVLIGPEQIPVKAGMVGMVPQNYLLFEHRQVGVSCLMAAKMREPDRTKARGKAVDLMMLLGIADKMDCYPKELSGGQRQRVSISEQLLSSNHFLLMDEPFSGLDIISKKKVCDVIDTVASRDELNTIIFSTHDIESAVMIADTVIILGKGPDGSGASVRASIDLVERDLAWHPDVERMPQFASTVAEIKGLFQSL